MLVKREWWFSTVAKLLKPYPSGSGELHRIRGPLVSQDHHGVWLGEAPSNLVHVQDQSKPIMARVFIPLNQIIALAVIDDPGKTKPGFGFPDLPPSTPAQ